MFDMTRKSALSIVLALALLAVGCTTAAPTEQQAVVELPASEAPPQEEETLDDAAQIRALVSEMQDAVLSSDRDLYLSNVDLVSDPVFAVEHSRWADDWADKAYVSRISMEVDDILVNGDTASATMSVSWRNNIDDMPGAQASYPVQFTRNADGWLYAGESWYTIEGETFRVHAMPGLESVAEEVANRFPEVYDFATSSLDHTPSARVEVKLYHTREALGANTLLSLPLITGWNEPGESIKLYGSDLTILLRVIAHEATHFITFDMADTGHGNYPWWVMEGIAEYVSTTFAEPGSSRFDEAHSFAQGLVENDSLVPWEDISDFETTPVSLWRYVYPQGYAFVAFVTETYGEDSRNEWLHLMATEMEIEEATQAAFGLTFDELSDAFVVWLTE